MTPLNYFDIHSHLYFPDFDTDRDEIISRMKEQGIWTTCIGTDLESSKKSIALAEKYDHIYATVGVHPEDTSGVDAENRTVEADFEQLAKHPRVVAIGECGFDFFRTEPAQLASARSSQKKIFQEQIDLAVRHGKALMLHGRPTKGTMNAYEDMLEVLESAAREHGEVLFGNAHFFVGSIEILQRFLDIGFTISLTGVVTFVRDYDGLVQYAPVDRIHAETDAPFVAPLSQRRKRNSPEYIVEIVEVLAKIRGIEASGDLENFKKQLISNAKRLYCRGANFVLD